MSTVSLIDPTTLNPSFAGPDTNRRGPALGRPAAIITRNDQEVSIELLTSLLAHAKQYRLQMLALSKAAANFGHSLEKIAHCKTAVMENPTSPTNMPLQQQHQGEEPLGSTSPPSLSSPQAVIGHVGKLSSPCPVPKMTSTLSPELGRTQPGSRTRSCLQAAAGLHFLISNHHQILSDTLYKQFEIPLLQHLDTHKGNIEASEAQYERSMREMSQKIKDTEAASLQNGRKRQRDLLQFRQALMTLTQQVDELERIKIGYYFNNLECEQANLQLILQKTSTLVRAEVDIYERVANKGLNDPILELMTTQGPDPYCVYPTTDEFSSIFSILPATPIIPTNPGNVTSGPTATQPEGILTTFYGYHETNPFSTSRTPTTAVPRDRHLFGDASSAESSASPIAKAVNGGKGAPSTSTSTIAGTGTLTGPTKKKDHSEDRTDDEKRVLMSGSSSPTPEDTIAAIESVATMTAATTTVSTTSTSPQADAEENENGQDPESETANDKESEAANGVDDNYFHRADRTSGSQASSLRTGGLDLRGSATHHRHYSSKTDDSTGPSSSTSTQSSLMRPYTHRSLSGSHHMTLGSTPESYPRRNMIHIPQDSELLNNRDFSFSYDPTDLLDRRSHAGIRAGDEFVNEFEGMERAPISDYTLNRTSASLHGRSMSHSSSTNLSHTESQDTQTVEDRQQTSSPLSSSVASSKQASPSRRTALEMSPPSSSREGGGAVATGPENQTDCPTGVEPEEDPYLHTLEHESKTARSSHRLSSREYDDGMPAFLSDEDVGDDNDEEEANGLTGSPSRSSTRDDLEADTRSLVSKRSSDTFRLAGFFRSNNNSTTDFVERVLVQAN
ncbi:hypothetical protein DFQ27_006321 [Actinomortierella ambigua]|uniref:Uncharacterized protein n=1 Tax=Actinomortierella ambigua TaxID=1343610 RepID=A0A9P6U1N0_9FUNG|nr:hypothetical protein DFQ27_006321 [Actinomortierella ambigua]